MNNIIDITERSQTRHALQEERELKHLDALSHGPVALVKSEGSEADGVNIDSRDSREDAMVAATRWPRSIGRNVRQGRATAGERLRYVRSRSMGLGSGNANCKVANAADQPRNLMIIEFNDVNARRKQNE
jgi:hypothetical protein